MLFQYTEYATNQVYLHDIYFCGLDTQAICILFLLANVDLEQKLMQTKCFDFIKLYPIIVRRY